jgi:large-conductance mechanosensitive channel
MEMNYYIFFVTAIIPLIIGFVWYGPLFGNVWMKEMGFTKESLVGQNMALTFILSYVFSFLISFFLLFLVVHQMGTMQVLQGEIGFEEKTGEAFTFFQNFLGTYGDRFRTFKHGALHGSLSGMIFVLPILSIIAMFERKNVKYVAINAGYWVVTLAIMGGIICQWI